MFSSIGVPGLIVILIIVLILFGPKKLPEIGGAVGKTLAEFKRSTKGIMDDDETPVQPPAQSAIQPPLPTPVQVTAAEEKKSETL